MLIKEASIKWNISERRIRKLIELGRIKGTKLGNVWTLPDDVSKPMDLRYKKDFIFKYDIDENEIRDINNKLNMIYKSRYIDRQQMALLKQKLDLENVYSTNSFYGNRLTLNEVRIVLEGITIPGRSIEEHLEIINYNKALKYIEKNPNIDIDKIKDIHRILMNGLDMDNNLFRNEYINEQLELVLDNYFKLKEYQPFLASIYIHGEILKIKPYNEYNGKIAKLILNNSLINNGISPIFVPREDKIIYLNAIENVIKNNDYTDLIKYLISKENEILNKYLKIIKL